jgi:hypothetical protein
MASTSVHGFRALPYDSRTLFRDGQTVAFECAALPVEIGALVAMRKWTIEGHDDPEVGNEFPGRSDEQNRSVLAFLELPLRAQGTPARRPRGRIHDHGLLMAG